MQSRNGYLLLLSRHAHPLGGSIVTETLVGAIAVVTESMIGVAKKGEGVIEDVAADRGGLTVNVAGTISIMTITMATKMDTTRTKRKDIVPGRAEMIGTGNTLKVSAANYCQHVFTCTLCFTTYIVTCESCVGSCHTQT